MNNDIQSNKMGTTPIPKLIISMSLPAILSMMVQAMYNIVDSIFVARIGEDALTAVSLAFPIQIIIISCFVGLGVGISSLVSRKLGEKNMDSAINTAEHGIVIGGALYVVIAVLGFTAVRSFFKIFTNDPIIGGYGVDYTSIVMIFSFGSIFAQAGMSILQGSGEMIKPMKTQMMGALTNIILDPIFIFGYFGFPRMGIKGAAVATVIGQIASMIYILLVIYRDSNCIKLNLKKFKYKSNIMKEILSVGLPATIMQALASVMIAGLNFILADFSVSAVAVLGVYFRAQSFVFMPVFGLSQGVLPIVGFNYGAKNKERLIKTIKIGMVLSLAYMIIGTIIFQTIPQILLSLFNATPEMYSIGLTAFRIISICFASAAISITLSTSFQGMGKAHISMIISFVRQIIVLIPSAYILGQIWGLSAIWFSFLISELVGVTIAIMCFLKIYKTTLSKFDENNIENDIKIAKEVSGF